MFMFMVYTIEILHQECVFGRVNGVQIENKNALINARHIGFVWGAFYRKGLGASLIFPYKSAIFN